jgi:CO dehydrogenase/acetyl-CoA synthase epsilon subunit
MTPFKINQTLQQDPITAVLHLRKASKPRRIKMLLNILDNYTDIGSRREAILKFKPEIEAIKAANKGFGPRMSDKELVEKVVKILEKPRHQ